MSGLYPIIDVYSLVALKLPVLDYARALLQIRPPLVQLRAKHLSARETLDTLPPSTTARGRDGTTPPAVDSRRRFLPTCRSGFRR